MYWLDRRSIKQKGIILDADEDSDGFWVRRKYVSWNDYVYKRDIIGKLVLDHHRVGAEVYFHNDTRDKTLDGTVEEVYSQATRKSFTMVQVLVHSMKNNNGSKESITPYDVLLSPNYRLSSPTKADDDAGRAVFPSGPC